MDVDAVVTPVVARVTDPYPGSSARPWRSTRRRDGSRVSESVSEVRIAASRCPGRTERLIALGRIHPHTTSS
jgi:hypothetical protein